ncbi:hypothetical protein BDZ91DRAFT_305677 [Kalaharituber pfeilii]|nr:hypothetical protein BDZ91DRAFT_305677 [Kalaharituber pfeilii]
MPRLNPFQERSFLLVALVTSLPAVSGMLQTGFNVTISEFIFNGFLPGDVPLPAACSAAYSSTVACDQRILISPNLDIKQESLEEACNPECAASMLMYERRVKDECAGVDLEAIGLKGTWLEFVVSGMAGIGVYWKNCLRDMETNELCLISQADYELAWNAATADSANDAAVKSFCSDNCLTQTIVLNVGTQENLSELQSMCGDRVDITQMPFIEHMVFAGLLRVSDDSSDTNMSTGATSPPVVLQLNGSALSRSVSIGMLLFAAIYTTFMTVIS